MNREFDVGDIVFCTESGVRGVVLRFYTPTSCEEQTLIQPDDDKLEYHAPTSLWKPYKHNQNVAEAMIFGVDLASGPDMTGGLLNRHGEYVMKYAQNHGISIAEAHEAPMVKAHLVAFNAMQDEANQIQWSPKDLNPISKALHDRYENGYLRSATD